jgi:hypothetical protein
MPHDTLFKAVFSAPVRAAELLRLMLPPELTRQIDWDSLVLEQGSYVDEELRSQHTDLLFAARLHGHDLRVYILFEHKSWPDGWVGLALHRYLGAFWNAHVKAEKPALLPPVLPVVVFHSQRNWTVATEFSRLVDLPPAAEVLRPFTPKFKFVLVDLASADPAKMEALAISPISQLAVRALNEVRPAPDVAAMWSDWGSLLGSAPRGLDWDAFIQQLFSYLYAIRTPEELRTINLELLGEGKVTMTLGEYLDKSRQEGKQETLLAQLRIKFCEVPAPVVARVETAEPGALNRWIARVLTASSLDEVFAETAG